MSPAVAFYADDFTGATDALLQLHRCGLRGVLLLRVDAEAVWRHAHRDVVGIAGIARSLPTGAMAAEVGPALSALWELGPRVLQYKACSTADSSPEVGSLGHAASLARDITGQPHIPMLVAQPDFGRYTAFATHFAAEEGVVHRLDRHPTMSRHPSTPVDEADLRLFLARQTHLPVGSYPFTAYGTDASLPTEPGITVLDALTDAHLEAAGRLILEAGEPSVFAMGSGGLSRAVGLSLGAAGDALPSGGDGAGTVLVVSGSRSAQTGRQIDAARESGWPVRAVTPEDLDSPDALAQWVGDSLADGGRAVVHSRDLPGDTSDLLPRLAGLYTFLARSARRPDADPTVVVCGGDTSSRMLRLMECEALEIDRHLTGNVVVSRLSAPGRWADGTRVLLKGGQVGPIDLFDQTLNPIQPELS